MADAALVDYAPAWRLAGFALLLALAPLCVAWVRAKGADRRARLAALTAITLFLAFDLVVFGSFTRLTDSGLGCPDWPGCYGHASPIGASAQIDAAQNLAPLGPVTMRKAWIEMVHRYLAMMVFMLCGVIAVLSWLERKRLPHSAAWPIATTLWVVAQGLFGRFTVTWKLYPAIVTLHLLGGMALLALLAMQHRSFDEREDAVSRPQAAIVGALALTLGLLVAQVALGGWVSTNYAVLACSDVPMCNGHWWPRMDFANGFTVLRALGQTGEGAALPGAALVAIHMTHRLFALVVLAAVVALTTWLARRHSDFAPQLVRTLVVLAVLQALSGLANVVLGWPLAAALLHSGGAAALVLTLTFMLARAFDGRSTSQASAA